MIIHSIASTSICNFVHRRAVESFHVRVMEIEGRFSIFLEIEQAAERYTGDKYWLAMSLYLFS